MAIIRTLCLVVFAFACAGASLAGGEEKGQAIRDALAAGRPVVLAVAKTFPPAGAESEGHADWAAYLNEFAAAHDSFAIVAIDRQEAAQLLTEVPSLDGGYATIFVRSPDSAVIYDGPILEELVYDAAASYLEAPADGQFDPQLFEPYTLRLK